MDRIFTYYIVSLGYLGRCLMQIICPLVDYVIMDHLTYLAVIT